MLENNKEEHLSYVDIDMSWGIWLKNWPMCCDAPWCTINSIVCHPKSLLSNVGKVVNSWMIWRCSLDQSRIRGSHLSRQTIKLYNRMRSWSEVGMPQLPCVFLITTRAHCLISTNCRKGPSYYMINAYQRISTPDPINDSLIGSDTLCTFVPCDVAFQILQTRHRQRHLTWYISMGLSENGAT